MASSNSLGPKYGEKGALMRNYRQRHQPPVQLQRAIGNDRRCMEMCPSPGLHVDRLGDRADPLPPKRKKRYEQHKARIQAGKAEAVLSQEGQAEGRRKTVAKKPPPVENTTPPREQSPQLRNTFRIARPPPLPQHPAARSTASEDHRTSSPLLPGHALAPSTSVWWVGQPHSTGPAPAGAPINPLLPAAKSDQKPDVLDSACYYFEFSAAPQTGLATLSHVPSQANTPSLESDSGTPSTIPSPPSLGTSRAEGTIPTTTPRSSYAAAGLDGTVFTEKEGADREVLSNTYCESSFNAGSSRNRISLEHEQEYANAPSIVLETASLPFNTVEQNPEFLSHLPPLRPALTDPVDVRRPGLTIMETAISGWTSTHPGQHFGHRNVLSTSSPGVLRARGRRTPASRSASRAAGAPRERRPGHATIDRHATRPYPSHSDRLAVGHGHRNPCLWTAERSGASQSAGYWTTPPIETATQREAQFQQTDGHTMGTLAPHDNPGHISAWSSPSQTPFVHTSATGSLPAPMAPTSLVNSVNHNRFGAPITMSTQRSELACTSMSAYSELAHAPIGDYPIFLPVMQVGIGAATLNVPLYTPLEIANPATTTSESLANWHSNLPIAPHPIITNPTLRPDFDAEVALGASHARAANNINDTARTFEGGSEEGEPFYIPVPPHGMDFATGQGLDETYLEASFADSQSDPHQQQLMTASTWSTWSGALSRLPHPY